jgi:hypothetical protein
MPDLEEKALQGAAKLHGFGRRQLDGAVIDPIMGEIHNQPWSTIALRNGTQRRDAEPWNVFDQLVRKDDKETFVGEIRHFITDKVNVVESGLVRASL